MACPHIPALLPEHIPTKSEFRKLKRVDIFYNSFIASLKFYIQYSEIFKANPYDLPIGTECWDHILYLLPRTPSQSV